MRTDCKTIRREIDEANLDDRLTPEVNEHLSGCDQCRRFHNDRRSLRSLMAELETVGAPADFDFRLRARLARERPSNGFGSLFRKAAPITAVALLVLIGVMLVVVKNWMSPADQPPVVKQTAPVNEALAAKVVPSPTIPEQPKDGAVGNGESSRSVTIKPHNVGGSRKVVAQRGTSLARVDPQFSTRDSAEDGAAMITPDSFASSVVVPVEGRALKLSIDNGRGGARTISLPPVTFGSQRLLAREASFVPATSRKGDW